MTQSQAKKKRLAKQRASGTDVTKQRGTAPFSTHERKTKTKQETIDQTYKKYKKHFQE
ncbi:hypothetical protein [Metasolibacillus meyeri]|uniref:hypothetical protein n=1 Tax=Metasolibacillus meyeri TaxID=1071052 RepID=UPI00187D3787|nr:hypothetical protein [Metasolibacillus meyeri]